jgi:hypothetical protein
MTFSKSIFLKSMEPAIIVSAGKLLPLGTMHITLKELFP